MALTVKDLKIGSRLMLGRYSANPDNPNPPRICWLKATPNCDFITEFAIDYLIYDFSEMCDNRDYELSNIRQYLNSDEREWFVPTHALDTPPNGSIRWSRFFDSYSNHKGFLYEFEDFELESIVEQHGDKITLPRRDNIFSLNGNQFELFRKKGARAKFTYDLFRRHHVYLECTGHKYNSFIRYMTRDEATNLCRMFVIGRNSDNRSIGTSDPAGVRPVCLLNPNTEVFEISPGIYEVVRFEVTSSTFDYDALVTMLGLM